MSAAAASPLLVPDPVTAVEQARVNFLELEAWLLAGAALTRPVHEVEVEQEKADSRGLASTAAGPPRGSDLLTWAPQSPANSGRRESWREEVFRQKSTVFVGGGV